MKASNTQNRQSHEVQAIIGHLTEARRGMERMMVLSGDWTAKIEVQADFDDVERSCRRFALHQFGMMSLDEQQD